MDRDERYRVVKSMLRTVFWDKKEGAVRALRWRLSRFALFVVILALFFALVMQVWSARQREAGISARLTEELAETQRLYRALDHQQFRSANSQATQDLGRPVYNPEP
jgi:hypothetical protein